MKSERIWKVFSRRRQCAGNRISRDTILWRCNNNNDEATPTDDFANIRTRAISCVDRRTFISRYTLHNIIIIIKYIAYNNIIPTLAVLYTWGSRNALGHRCTPPRRVAACVHGCVSRARDMNNILIIVVNCVSRVLLVVVKGKIFYICLAIGRSLRENNTVSQSYVPPTPQTDDPLLLLVVKSCYYFAVIYFRRRRTPIRLLSYKIITYPRSVRESYKHFIDFAVILFRRRRPIGSRLFWLWSTSHE